MANQSRTPPVEPPTPSNTSDRNRGERRLRPAKAFATASLVTGLFALLGSITAFFSFFGMLLGVVALVLAGVSLHLRRGLPGYTKPRLAVGGLATGAVAVVVALVWAMVIPNAW